MADRRDRCNVKGVIHKLFFADGGVQALAFEDSQGRKTVGVVTPGKWYFGMADKPETIVITSGELKINKKTYRPIMSCQIKAGDSIIFETEGFVTYLCYKD